MKLQAYTDRLVFPQPTRNYIPAQTHRTETYPYCTAFARGDAETLALTHPSPTLYDSPPNTCALQTAVLMVKIEHEYAAH
jgi:hypothetical protein